MMGNFKAQEVVLYIVIFVVLAIRVAIHYIRNGPVEDNNIVEKRKDKNNIDYNYLIDHNEVEYQKESIKDINEQAKNAFEKIIEIFSIGQKKEALVQFDNLFKVQHTKVEIDELKDYYFRTFMDNKLLIDLSTHFLNSYCLREEVDRYTSWMLFHKSLHFEIDQLKLLFQINKNFIKFEGASPLLTCYLKNDLEKVKLYLSKGFSSDILYRSIHYSYSIFNYGEAGDSFFNVVVLEANSSFKGSTLKNVIELEHPELLSKLS